MKKISFLAMFLLSLGSFAQTKDSVTIDVVYPKKSTGQGAAILVDDQLVSGYLLRTIDPRDIQNVNLSKNDTTLNGLTYKGSVKIRIKSESAPQFISLADLKRKYTSLKSGPTIYMINDEMISGTQGELLMDEKRIIKILVDEVNAGDGGPEIAIVKLLTKPVEKLKGPIESGGNTIEPGR